MNRIGGGAKAGLRLGKHRPREVLGRAGTFLKWRMMAPALIALYRSVTCRFSGWPLVWFASPPKRDPAGAKRIGYYVDSFPAFSETFIQREVAALKSLGLPVQVLAHETHGAEHFDDDAKRLMNETCYFEALDPKRCARAIRWFLLVRPLALINVFLYVLFCRYHPRKSFGFDMRVFRQAVYLAGVLKEKGIDHVHAPWANMYAFVAQLAARLLSIPYTVQARAYDIHRNTSVAGLPAKLVNADFVVTNARYNQSVLEPLLPRGGKGKVHVIYEGIDLNRVRPARPKKDADSVLKMLAVANLVEAKGLEYLIRACKILKDRGRSISCEIIGRRMPAESNTFIRLEKLRRALALEDEVVFLGPQSFDVVLQKYGEADIFVLPSVVAPNGSGDVTPNALIEAMAMQLPVISTRSRGIPEIVEDGVSGILVPARNERALAEAIIRLADDKELRSRLGKNARKRVEERFDIHRNMRGLAALFRTGVPEVGAEPASGFVAESAQP
jgi:glycosyltransferase involved in cell wall biosynthesis